MSAATAPARVVNPWLIALTVTITTFIEVLDTSIANVALPHIAGNLGASIDDANWVLTSYLVANAMVIPLSSWLSTALGRKRYYMGCVALFTLTSALCGLATSLPMLILWRFFTQVTGDPARGQLMGLRAIRLVRDQQAYAQAFLDCFWVFTLIALAIVPLTLLMKRSVVEGDVHVGE